MNPRDPEQANDECYEMYPTFSWRNNDAGEIPRKLAGQASTYDDCEEDANCRKKGCNSRFERVRNGTVTAKDVRPTNPAIWQMARKLPRSRFANQYCKGLLNKLPYRGSLADGSVRGWNPVRALSCGGNVPPDDPSGGSGKSTPVGRGRFVCVGVALAT